MSATAFPSLMFLLIMQVPAEVPARGAALPPDLAAVPANGLGFVHIRVADIWKSDSMKDLRETVLKAGVKAIEGFDARFLPHPSTIERLTIVLLAQDETLDREPLVFAILAVNKAFDKDAFLKSALPNAVKKEIKGSSYYLDEKGNLAVSFVDEQTIAFGPAAAIQAYNATPRKADGALAAALQLANSKREVVAAVNLSLIPAKAFEQAPPPVRPLLKAKLLTMALDISSDLQIDAGLTFDDEKQADEANEAIKALAVVGRNEMKTVRKEMLAKALGDGKIAPLSELPEAAGALFMLGSLERIDEMLADPPIKRDGKTLRASVKAAGGTGIIGFSAIGVGLLLPAVQKVREAAARASSQNNLKQIGLAMQNHAATYNDKLPGAAICDKNGKPLLSWRVPLLPYIEQNNLYKQFKLDEPWDSEHNLPLSEVVVKTYTNPLVLVDPSRPGLCHYRLFYGKDAMFGLSEGRSIATIPDGTSNTFMVVEAAEGVPWTKPDDFLYDAKKPLPKFSNITGRGFNAVFGDGSVRFISNTTSEKTLRALITANGGEVIDDKDRP